MIDLTTIPSDTITARGQYATIRSAHEDEKKRLSILCGQLSTAASQVLRFMQPANDEAPDMAGVLELLKQGRKTLDDIEQSVDTIEALAMQRAALKAPAWGRP